MPNQRREFLTALTVAAGAALLPGTSAARAASRATPAAKKLSLYRRLLYRATTPKS